MNRRLTYILTLGLLLLSGVAMGQRADDPENPVNNTTAGVKVGGNVFGGGNLANVKGSSSVLVDQKGAVIGTKTGETLVAETGDVYGGGALAKVNVTATTTNDNTTYSQTTGKSTQVTLRQGTVYGNLYGGGLGVRPEGEDEGTPADVYGPVTVTVNGGTVEGSVFGCNNLYGAPKSTVNVVVLKEGTAVMNIHNVYGGGNLADFTAPGTTPGDYPEVNIKHGTVGGSVFGGGYGASAEVTGNPQVTIGDDDTDHTAIVSGNVYGGGDEALVAGNTLVTVQNAHSQVALDVYGGGNQANVSGSDIVNIINGTIGQDVYGGGALADVGTTANDNTVVNVLGGTVSGNVYGGGLGRKASQGVEPIEAKVNGVVTVNIGKQEGELDDHGFATAVSGEATINGNVFGCNNTNGSPKDNVTVNIYKTFRTDAQQTSGTGFALSQVFGGGNQANYEPATTGKKATVHVWTCDNTIEYIYGGGNAADLGTLSINSATNVVIDGGRIEWVFGGGNGYSETGNHTDPSAPNYNPGANINGNTQVTYHAGNITYVFGGSNQFGIVSGSKTVDILSDGSCTYDNHITELYGGNNEAPSTGDISLTMGCPEHLCDIGAVYGGSRNADIDGNVTLTIIGGQYNQVFGGNNIGGTITGDVTLNLYGGTINSAYGGNNQSGRINGKIIVNVLDDMSKDNDDNWTCPLILHNVYGGGYDAPYNPSTDAALAGNYPEVNIIQGTVSTKAEAAAGTTGNVFGGGYGTTAVVKHNPKVRVGYDATMSGYIPTDYPVQDDERTALVENNVFGGGDQAAVAGSTTVILQHANSSVASLFGGGNLASVGNATVNVDGGAVSTGVYGGCNESGSVGGDIFPYTTTLNNNTQTYTIPNTAIDAISYEGDVVVDVVGGTIGGPARANIHGGGYGHQTSTTGDVTVTFGAQNTEHSDLPTLTGDLYGGSALGNVGATSSTTTVNVINGKIIGDVYGGGLGDDDYAAAVNGDVAVYIGKTMGTTLYNTAQLATYNDGAKGGNVFGCNNANGAPTGNVQVNINGNVAKNVFGGGNLAAYTGAPDVNIIAGTVSGNVFGGGNEAGVGGGDVAMTGGTVVGGLYGGCNTSGVVSGNIVVNVNGGTVGTNDSNNDDGVFGGGFGNGTSTTGDVTVTINGTDVNVYGDVYGGSAKGNVNGTGKSTTVTLSNGTVHGNLYGGGLGDATNAASVNGAVLVKVNGGTVNDVFGCNNVKGAPQSTVQVDIEQTGASMSVINVFGGGNLAVYGGSPVVNIKNGTVSGNVYGGGNGDPDSNTQEPGSTAAPTVIVGDLTTGNEGYVAIVTGDVYGGGNAAKVTGNVAPTVSVLNKCNTEIGYVYGGGNAADVPATNVTIAGGTVHHDVFGGGHGDNTPGNLKAANVTNNVSVSVTGAKIDRVFAGSNLNGTIGGNMTLNINKADEANCNMKIGEVYGGGNLAAGKAGMITIGCTGDWTSNHTNHNSTTNRIGYELEGIGTVYGGANQAGISNNITLNINSGIVENVFGGNNTDGEISGTITVNIEKSGNCDWYVGNVYGGGNLAAYSPETTTNNPAVNIKNGIVSGNVFGGGLGATAKVRSNTKVTVGDLTPANSSYEAVVLGNVYGGGSAAMVGDDGVENNTTVLVQQANSSVSKVFGGGMAAGVTGTSTVTVADGSVVNSIFGGCDTEGTISGNIVVNVTGGEIGTHDLLYANTPKIAQVFGGGYGHQTSTGGNVTVNIGTDNDNHSATPTIWGDVYGGSAEGNVNPETGESTTTVNVYNGTLESNIIQNNDGFKVYYGGNVYGGGLGTTGHPAAVYGTVGVNIGAAHTNSDPTGAATIKGNVYGCNNAKGTPKKDVTVNVYKTYQSGSNEFNYVPTPGAPATYAIANVFGGGNEADYEPGSNSNKANVNIVGCYNTIERVFGGSNAAASGTADHPIDGVFTTIDGGRIDKVFGGGNGEVSAANINGDVTLAIHGGSVNQFFVGSNQQGSVSGESHVTADNSSCPFVIDEFFCGGNYAPIHGNVITTIDCGSNVAGMQINNLYGGCNMADILDDEATTDVEGNVQLTVKGGSYKNIYGGSKGSPAPTGPDVTEEDLDAASADISGNVTLNIFGGTVTEAIYGGSNVNGSIGGNITVTIEDQNGEGDCPLDVEEADVYGAGNLAIYTAPSGTGAQANNPTVYINHAEVKNVFGGGKGDEQVNTQVPGMVTGNPKVIIGDSDGSHTAAVKESVYGGGNAAKVDGTTTVVMQNGHSTVQHDIYGGGNLANVTGATSVSVNNGTVTQDVYGGGALANTNGSNVTLDGGTVRAIYGGGLGDEDHPAEVSGAVQVTVNNGTVVDVFGCNNVKGAPTSTVQVNINNNVTNSVYGGGNQAACSVSPAVYINKGVVGGNVFGGGLGEGAIVTGTPTVTIGDLTNGENAVATVTGDVYGGGDAAKVKGTTSVLVQKCNTVINGDVYGGGNAADIAKNNGAGGSTSVVVTGGTINSSNADHGNVFGGGHGNQSTNTSANVEGNTSVAINGGTINRVFGGANSKGDIGGSTSVFVEKDDDACSLHITEVYGGGNVADGKAGLVTIVCTGDGANEGVGDVYGGARAAGVTGDITLNITGGKIDNVFGGNNVSGAIDGKITVNVDWGTDCDDNSIGNVYGGGNQAAYSSPMTTGENPVPTNYPEVNILNGTVSTNVFGGGLGEGALVTGNPVVNINGGTVTGSTFGGGSAAPVKGNPTVNAKKGNATTVFGGGWGATAVVTGDPTVVVNQTSGESLNVTDVYGGGDQAEVVGNTNVQLKAGSVSNAFGGGNVADITGTTTVSLEGATAANIYGGGNQANVSNTTTVSVSSGNATTGVYGGCNTSGEVGGKVTVSVTGGTMGIAPTGTPGQEGYNAGQRANVHGGGYGNGTSTKGDVDVTIDGASAVIWGDVYGGSAKGHVNDASTDKTNVTLNHGTIHGDLYGGGLGDANNAALVKGAVQVTVNGGTVTGAVYGCNNANGTPQSTVKVDVYGTDTPSSGYALGNVFGGGNQAAYTGVPEVKIHNCNNSIEYVYGGGNAANVNGTDVTIYGGNSIAHVFGGCYGADVTNDGTDVKIYGGTIGTIYGGNNESGTIAGNIRVTVNKTADADPNGSSTACEMHINEVYGGGNKAASNAGQITIGCTGTGTTEGIQYVYGGANRADVTGPINLKIEEGRIANVFGGNNNSGSISGAITVTIEKKASPCIWDIGNVFGGGNLAEYSGTPSVNVKNGTVANVYGGGNGDPDDDTQMPGQVTGTNVTIGDDTESYSAIVTGNVYGGGNAAKVSGNTLVVYNDSNSTSSVSNLFGGGNQAGVTGTTQVTLANGSVTTGVYGGCNEKGNIGGKVTVNVSGGTVGSLSDLESTHTTADVFGGGYGQQTSTSNDVEVNVGVPNSTEHSDFPKIYGDVYGGSALGNVNAQATDKTTVNIYNGTLYSEPGIVNGFTVYYGGNVYGGGLGRKDDQNTAGVNEAVEAKVFGEVTVNIGSGTVTEGFTPSTNTGEAIIKGNVYGCNNANGSPQQNVTVNIFKTAHTTTDTYNYDPAQNGNVPATYALANVFGGGNEADFQINGKTATVNVYGCDNTIQRTFGGSNAAASYSVFTMIQGGRILEAYGGGNGEVKPANVDGNVSLAIHGGSVGQSFGGSNQQGTITGSSTVTVDSQGGCGEPTIEEYFCGGNFADYYGNIEATIECADGMHIKNLYGGCKQADVLPSGNQIGNVHLVVKGGTYENIFGGSQGRRAGTDPAHPDAESADISGHILLEIFGGTVTNAIYGGSHILGDVKGTITVNIENKNTGCPLDLSEADVYGGGNQADYKTPTIGGKPELHDYPQVNIKNATVNNVFGGGLEAEVKGNPQIRIKKGSKVLGNVYGGGNLGEVDGDPRVIVNGKDDSDNPTDSLEIEIN